MDITLTEIVRLIVVTLPEIMFITVSTLLSLSLLALLAYLFVKWRKSKKPSSLYTFTPEEWKAYTRRAAKSLLEEYDITPKGEPSKSARDKIIGTWCNEDDSLRFYISDRGGFIHLTLEDRRTPKVSQITYIVRNANSNPIEPNVFFAEREVEYYFVFGYDEFEDKIHVGSLGEFERIESYMEGKKIHPKDVVFDADQFLADYHPHGESPNPKY